MAQTPLTTATPYATAADLFVYHDWQACGDLLRDADAPRPVRAALLSTSSVLGAMLNRLLLAASGELESACLVGKRYQPADLTALTGAGAEQLKKIVCDLTFWRLRQRRQPGASDPKTVPGALQAVEALVSLRKGETIFGFVEAAEAGLDEVVGEPSGGQSGGARVSVIDSARRLFGGHGQ